MAIALVCLLSNTADAQRFTLSLDRLTEVYDELYPERTRAAVWDTVDVDLSVLQLGDLYYEVPNFLRHDFGHTTTRVEYGTLTDYRVTLTYAPVYSLVPRDSAAGVFTVRKPREFDVPGLEVELRPMSAVVDDVRERSLQQVWRESTREFIGSRQRMRRTGKGGITIDIPIPMPRQLESIFGPSEKTHINITGREEITFAGETRVVKPFIGVEGRESQSLFPSLDMKQTLDVRLTGTIGDKVNIQVDHSSEALTDDANRIRLNYTGYDDDVIQLIELGNTSLSLPGSQLVNFSSQSKGLFGVKVLAQLGATDITFIASKQEGETSSASFSPTAGSIGSTESRNIRDIDYVKNKYFFFDDPYDGLVSSQLPEVSSVRVYRELKGSEINELGANVFAGRAFVDSTGDGATINAALAPLASGNFPARPSESGWFELLDFGTDYSYVIDAADGVTPLGIELSQPISSTEQRVLAVEYVTEGGAQVGGQRYSELWGGDDPFPPPPDPPNPAVPDTLVLKMLKSRTPRSTGQFALVWNYMMRNIYNLGLSNIDRASFRLDIKDNLDPGRLVETVPDTLDVPYIRIFGLDRFDESGQPGSDSRVDLQAGLIDLRNGTLTFPALRPFAPPPDNVQSWTDGEFAFEGQFQEQYQLADSMYSASPSVAGFENFHQYTIVVEAVSTSKTFRIDALNIIENSEVVTLDGNRLSRGTDYDIDYVSGEIELKGGILSELTPASKIDIDYDYKPFGGGGSSSLVGFSTLSVLGENARVGSTFLYESKNVTSEKPRVGEEPTRAIVGGTNANFQHQSEALTRMVNVLPLVDTDAPSTLNLSGELAVSIPDPNTRGEAYIDDFEGVEDSDRLSMSRQTWQWGSVPLVSDSTNVISLGDSTTTNRLDFLWYNLEPELALRKRDLNPELDERENTLLTALDIELDPGFSVEPEDSNQWAGVMTGFAGGGLDLTQGQFIEFWVNDFKPNAADRGGKVRIDLGFINENFYEPLLNEFNDEDRDRDGFAVGFDDTGFDGLFNEDEGAVEPGGTPEDPHGDDIDVRRINGRFVKVNGTEGNQRYDTEDLDRSGQLDGLNAYFSFVVDLSDTAVVDVREEFPGYDGWVNEHRNDSWRLYRIKLSDHVEVSPTGVRPLLDQIRHMRIWFKDVGKVVHTRADEPGARRIQFAELKILGNRWEEDGIRTLADVEVPNPMSEFAIGVISNKSDPGLYNPPVRPNVENQVADKETSLFLRYDNLGDSTQVRILKRFQGQGMDLTQYRDLNLWVHADRLDSDLRYYFRLGTNEKNFYEVAIPLQPEYFGHTGWSRVQIKLEDLTQLKFSPVDSTTTGTAADLIEPRTYPIRLVGAPSLFSVRFLYAGVRSLGTGGALHSGEIWMNDIYVGDVRRDIDFAQRVSGQLNLGGGVVSINAGWQRTGPDFRGLRQRRGSGTENQSYNVGVKTALQHFIPLGGFRIPVSGNYRKTTQRPKFVPNSDTEITEEALRDSLQSVNETRGFATSLSKKNSTNWLLKYTIDKISTNFTYNRSHLRSPASRDTTTSMSGTLGYQITWTGKKEIRIFRDFKLRWWLNSLDVRTSASRRTSRRWRLVGDRFRPDPYSFSAALTNSGTVNYQPFKSITSSFSMNIDRDVRLPHEWLGVDVGTEVARSHNLKVNYRPPAMRFIKEFSPDLSITTNYSEDSSPRVRRPGDPRGTRNANANRTASLKMRYDIGKTFRKLFGYLGVKTEDSDARGRGRPPARPPTGAQGSAGADTTEAAAAEPDTTSAGADPMLAVRKLAQVMADIRRVNVSVTQRTSSNYQRVPERPDLGYQFGLSTEAGVETPEQTDDRPDQLNESLTLNADSGVQLSDDIDVATRYSRTVTDTDFRTSQSRATSTTFPDVQLSWKGLERIGLFRPLFKTTQANMNLKQFTQESGLLGREPENTREALTLAPSLLFTWKNDVKSTLGVSYNKNTSDTRGSRTETTNLSVNLDFTKTFLGGAGFKIPIPFFTKEVKWASKLDTSLKMAYSRTGGKRFLEGTEFSTPIPSTSSLRISPTVAYQFSDALNGRAFIDYGRSYNESTDQTITTIRVGVTAVFTF